MLEDRIERAFGWTDKNVRMKCSIHFLAPNVPQVVGVYSFYSCLFSPDRVVARERLCHLVRLPVVHSRRRQKHSSPSIPLKKPDTVGPYTFWELF